MIQKEKAMQVKGKKVIPLPRTPEGNTWVTTTHSKEPGAFSPSRAAVLTADITAAARAGSRSIRLLSLDFQSAAKTVLWQNLIKTQLSKESRKNSSEAYSP